MRVAFAGTPPFAARALEALASSHEVALVLTQPDRPSGRGLRLTESAVGEVARRLEIPVAKPSTLRSDEALEPLRFASPDVLVVAAYGLLLPPTVLALPPRGCLNIHASLLPRWRGAAPIHRAIQAGDPETGIAIMQMDAELDTGPVLLERRIPITASETTATLTAKLADLGAAAICDALSRLDGLEPKPQPQVGVTYAAKVTKAESRLDWTLAAAVLERQVRAFDPAPGSETSWKGAPLKVWSARVGEGHGAPGDILAVGEAGIHVACGEGALVMSTVQRPGGRRQPAGEAARALSITAGARLV